MQSMEMKFQEHRREQQSRRKLDKEREVEW